MILSFLIAFPLFASGLSFLFSIGEIVANRSSHRNQLLAACFFCLGFILSNGWLLLSGVIFYYPHFFQTTVPVFFLIGPLLRRYFRVTLEGPISAKLRYHFIPAVICVILLTPWFLASSEEKISNMQHILEFSWDLPHILFPVSIIHLCTYVLFLPHNQYLLNRESLGQAAVRIVLFLTVFAIFDCVLAVMARVLHSRAWFLASVDVLALIVPALYLLQRKLPGFFQDLGQVIEDRKYKQSQIKHLDLNQIETRLNNLMKEKAIYKDEYLSLASLAEQIGISSHQTSEYLNNVLGTNFPGFINSKRIEEARRLIQSEPDKTILAISLEVGFNSKSAFNAAFLKHTGKSPSGFKRKADRETPGNRRFTQKSGPER